MSEIKIIIDGIECKAQSGETILEIARANGIYIPTLCHDESVAKYGACGLCLVEGGRASETDESVLNDPGGRMDPPYRLRPCSKSEKSCS